MSSKSDLLSLNSSNGFKKRLLRPVSTNKQHEPKHHDDKTNNQNMRNSRLTVSIKDSLSIKNKYCQAMALMQGLEKEMEERQGLQNESIASDVKSNLSCVSAEGRTKGLEYVKKQASILHQKKVSPSTPFSSKPTPTILTQLRTQNLQQATKLLYHQNTQLHQLVERSCYVLCLDVLKKNVAETKELMGRFDGISGSEEVGELFVKLMGVVCGEKDGGNESGEGWKGSVEEEDFVPQTKFKTIFTAKNEAKENDDSANYQSIIRTQQLQKEIAQLKTELTQLRQTNNELLASLSQHQSRQQTQPIVTNQPTPSSQVKVSTYLQKIHKELKSMYEEALRMKSEDLQKLKYELVEKQQQIVSKQNIAYQLTSHLYSSDPDKRQQPYNSQFSSSVNHSTSNPDHREFASTIQEEFQKMRTGFTKKLQKLQVEFAQKQQKLKKQIFSLEKQFQKTEWEKRILLKKYEFLVNQ